MKTPMPSVRFFSKFRISIIVTASLLAGFIGFLLLSNYSSLQKLREVSLKQYQHELEQRATEMTHLLSDHNHGILTLTENERIRRYFENKALGMSMEYGLRSSIRGINREIRTFITNARHGNDTLFKRLVFLDTNGDIISDSLAPSDQHKLKLSWRKEMLIYNQGYYVCENENHRIEELLYVLPYHFKGALQGQLLLWFDLEFLATHYFIPKSQSLFMGMTYSPEHIAPPPYTTYTPLQNHKQLFSAESKLPEIQKRLESTERTLLFRVPIGTSGFQLAEIASSKAVLGTTSPFTLLVALGLLAVIILATTIVLLHIIGKNIALQTRITEAQKREDLIALKNMELQSEIEERKRSEATQRQLEKQLQHVQKMEAIGLLAGGVAHDLNNILSGIVSYPELLLLNLPADSSMRKPLEIIKKSGLKASAIVQDLLTLARRGVATRRVVNLNQIIRDYLASPEHHKMLEQTPAVEIELHLATDLLNILGSPVHLSKSIMNIVSNAIEAMPNGGNIHIHSKNIYIDKPLKTYDNVQEGEYALVIIKDHGIGISLIDIDRIFEPFYSNKKMGRSGTGLGMAVVWGTIKDHHGYVEIESVEGESSTVTMYFPVTRKPLTQEQEGQDLVEILGNKESILLVDDVEEQRIIASDILEKLQYTVFVCSSGEQAIEFLEKNTVDLVILDMIMDPGIDGLETYKNILKTHPEQKAMITSGYSETDRVKEAQLLGTSKYISKPYTIDSLATAVKYTLHSAV